MQLFLCVAVGFFFGSINPAFIISKFKGFDIRERGSGNAGASNALVTMGKGAAVATALVDILKAFVPVFLLRNRGPVCSVQPEGYGGSLWLLYISLLPWNGYRFLS